MRATILVLFCGLTLAACSIHRVDIQQGNMIEATQLAKLKVGMDKSQARFVMGTPLITDPFHDNRWDYVYRRRDESGNIDLKRVSLFFSNDVVERIEIEPETLAPLPQ